MRLHNSRRLAFVLAVDGEQRVQRVIRLAEHALVALGERLTRRTKKGKSLRRGARIAQLEPLAQLVARAGAEEVE